MFLLVPDDARLGQFATSSTEVCSGLPELGGCIGSHVHLPPLEKRYIAL